MGALTKVVDAVLFLFFLIVALVAPLIDGQLILPLHLYPTILVDVKRLYIGEYGDYLSAEKPHFFVGIIWHELLVQWPLALACLYGIAASKPWFNTACLIYGVSATSCMAAVLAELVGSGRASDKLLTMYYPFTGCGVLAVLRGLCCHCKTATTGKRVALNRKKKA